MARISREELRHIIREELRYVISEEVHTAIRAELSPMRDVVDSIESILLKHLVPDVIPNLDFHDRYERWQKAQSNK